MCVDQGLKRGRGWLFITFFCEELIDKLLILLDSLVSSWLAPTLTLYTAGDIRHVLTASLPKSPGGLWISTTPSQCLNAKVCSKS